MPALRAFSPERLAAVAAEDELNATKPYRNLFPASGASSHDDLFCRLPRLWAVPRVVFTLQFAPNGLKRLPSDILAFAKSSEVLARYPYPFGKIANCTVSLPVKKGIQSATYSFHISLYRIRHYRNHTPQPLSPQGFGK